MNIFSITNIANPKLVRSACFGICFMSLAGLLTACGGGGGGGGSDDSAPAPPETPTEPQPDPAVPDPGNTDPDPDPVDPPPVTPVPDPIDPTPVDPEPTDPEPDPGNPDQPGTPTDPTDPAEPAYPDPEIALLLGNNARALNFDGNATYLSFDRWQSGGQYRVVGWLDFVPDNNDWIYLASEAGNGDYLAFNRDSVEAQFNGTKVNINGKFDFANYRYVEFTVSNGRLEASDGQTTASVSNGAIKDGGTGFEYSFRHNNDYSKGALQAIGFMDLGKPENSRGYRFNDQRQVIETNSEQVKGGFNGGQGDWLDLSANVVTPRGMVTSQAEWDAAFEREVGSNRPLIGMKGGNMGERFAWEGHYWLRAYIMMAKTYNDDKYLDYATELADHMFRYTDAERVQRGELNLYNEPYDVAPKAYLNNRGTGAPGWRREYGSGHQVEVLIDGQILNAIMRLVNHIKSNQIGKYAAKAETYLERAKEIANSHNTSYSNTKNAEIPGAYHFVNPSNSDTGDGGLYGNPTGYNHNMTMGIALIYLDKWLNDGDSSYGQKVQEIHQFFTKHWWHNDDGTCTWNYAFDTQGRHKLEDINHAHLDVGFMITAYNEGFIQDDKEVRCIAKTMAEKVFFFPGVISWDVAGGGVSPIWDQVATGYDWDEYVVYDNRIHSLNKHILRHWGHLDWYRPYLAWANVLYWNENFSR